MNTSAIKTTDPSYTKLSNTVQKLLFCDVQIKLEKIRRIDAGQSEDQHNENIGSFDISWEQERNGQLLEYCNNFDKKVKDRLKQNILFQRICIYSDKIYSIKHPEYSYYLKTGKFTSLLFLTLAGLTLASAAIIGLLNYRESSKYNYPIQVNFTLLFIFSSLCIISSYIFNLAFVLAMRTAEYRKALFVNDGTNVWDETMPWVKVERATLQSKETQ
ncbi:MAG: hypothetical protein C5B43_03450 [Verrucomicrobia bacterium]|nr:MAG: hypothetical protein C5B43_03450 [Verrucomicrobiota bacterium]